MGCTIKTITTNTWNHIKQNN